MNEVIQRGRDAKAWLEDAYAQGRLDQIAEETIKRWRSSAAGAVQLREHYAAEVRAIDALRAKAKQEVSDADFEQRKLDKERARERR